MEIGLVRKVDIDHEMQQSYLDYAMSVIVARALPDARDGLKPVQRRILYGMYDMGLRADSAYKKSARIVGEVLGKYHPHGDQAVYDAMARMAQDFTMRYPLVDGQGNFGSIDGDPPAAMRYTEARLTPIALDLLLQLDRDTVDFERNFDDSLNEPVVLPAALPNLLINGASGIAVGMATSIPPHNLGEVIDALIYMLERWERLEDIGVDDLIKFVRGPDFPTGGIILQEEGGEDLLTAYATGRGKVTLRGKVQLEEMGRGKSRIIITELPYQINKSSLIERIAELARENELEGISDLRDESDRQGMRIVIELNKVAEEQNVLRELYRRTPLQSTFRISLLALVDGEPRLLSLKQALRVYLDHRITVVRRRSEHDLEKARQRAHILEGLRIALANLDEIINLIRKAQDVDDARTKLMKRYKLSEIQANAILEMQLRRLAALERKKIELEYQETVKLIKTLTELLRSAKKLREAVAEELLSVKQKYADRRRTQIVSLKQGEAAKDVLTTSELMPEEKVWVGVTGEGMIGRISAEKQPRLTGKDAPETVLFCSSNHTLYLAACDGKCAAIAIQSLPDVENFSEGIPISKACPLSNESLPVILFSAPLKIPPEKEFYIVTISRNGMVKKTELRELPGPSAQTFTLVKINAGDELQNVLITDGSEEIILVSKNGMMIRFPESEVRPMGLVAAGVNGIKLSSGDEVVGSMVFNKEEDLLLVAEDGKGWRIPASQTVLQGRYGQGIIAARLVKGSGLIGAVSGIGDQSILVYFERLAAKSIPMDNIAVVKRATSGKPIFDLRGGEKVRAIKALVNHLGKWETSKPEKPARRSRQVAEKSTAVSTRSSQKPANEVKTRGRRAQSKQAELPLENMGEISEPKEQTKRKTQPASSTKGKASTSTKTSRKSSVKPPASQPEMVQPTPKKRGRRRSGE